MPINIRVLVIFYLETIVICLCGIILINFSLFSVYSLNAYWHQFLLFKVLAGIFASLCFYLFVLRILELKQNLKLK